MEGKLKDHHLDHIKPSSHLIRNGWASVSMEITGADDYPADINDPTSPDRLWSSVLDWCANSPGLTQVISPYGVLVVGGIT